MPTGFIRRHCISLLLAALPLAALAGQVSLIGVIGDKAAVLAIDGGEPKTVKVGQTWSGVTVISVQKTQAVVEMEGAQRVLVLGQHYRGTAPVSSRPMATLAADPRGHFFTEASINDVPMRVVVDTGASVVVIPASDAARLRLDWRNGEKRTLQTANGPTTGYTVKLANVRVGTIELHEVEAIVLEQGLSVGLLGMSFLNRVEMKRDGDVMTLTRRF